MESDSWILWLLSSRRTPWDEGVDPAEMRERAVWMVLDHQHEYRSQWEAISSVADKLGPTPETVRSWVRQSRK